MGTIHKTGCILCAQNCGLEFEVDDNRIVKVKRDRSNVRSEGYVCRKGMNIAYHQHNSDRLKHSLKRVGNAFERISWDQAIDETEGKSSGRLSTGTVPVPSPTWAAGARDATSRQHSASA